MTSTVLTHPSTQFVRQDQSSFSKASVAKTAGSANLRPSRSLRQRAVHNITRAHNVEGSCKESYLLTPKESFPQQSNKQDILDEEWVHLFMGFRRKPEGSALLTEIKPSLFRQGSLSTLQEKEEMDIRPDRTLRIPVDAANQREPAHATADVKINVAGIDGNPKLKNIATETFSHAKPSHKETRAARARRSTKTKDQVMKEGEGKDESERAEIIINILDNRRLRYREQKREDVMRYAAQQRETLHNQEDRLQKAREDLCSRKAFIAAGKPQYLPFNSQRHQARASYVPGETPLTRPLWKSSWHDYVAAEISEMRGKVGFDICKKQIMADETGQHGTNRATSPKVGTGLNQNLPGERMEIDAASVLGLPGEVIRGNGKELNSPKPPVLNQKTVINPTLNITGKTGKYGTYDKSRFPPVLGSLEMELGVLPEHLEVYQSLKEVPSHFKSGRLKQRTMRVDKMVSHALKNKETARRILENVSLTNESGIEGTTHVGQPQVPTDVRPAPHVLNSSSNRIDIINVAEKADTLESVDTENIPLLPLAAVPFPFEQTLMALGNETLSDTLDAETQLGYSMSEMAGHEPDREIGVVGITHAEGVADEQKITLEEEATDPSAIALPLSRATSARKSQRSGASDRHQILHDEDICPSAIALPLSRATSAQKSQRSGSSDRQQILEEEGICPSGIALPLSRATSARKSQNSEDSGRRHILQDEATAMSRPASSTKDKNQNTMVALDFTQLPKNLKVVEPSFKPKKRAWSPATSVRR